MFLLGFCCIISIDNTQIFGLYNNSQGMMIIELYHAINEYFLENQTYILCEVLTLNKVLSKKKAVLVLLAVVILILSALLLANSKTASKSTLMTEGKNKLAAAGEVTAASNSSSLVYCARDLLIEVQGENVRAKNIKGDVAWSQKLPDKIVRLADAGENIVIIDSQNNINYFSSQGKLLWSSKSSFEIIDLMTDDDGNILVEYKGLTGSRAEVFMRNGSKIGNILVENAHIISFSVGDSYFAISVLDTYGEAIVSKIIAYNFKGDILWAHNFENRIISKLCRSSNNRLLALGDNMIYMYKNDGSLQKQAEIEGEISNIAMNDNIIAAVVHYEGKQYAVCYDKNLRRQSRIEIMEDPIGIFPTKNGYIIYYSDELLLFTMKGELSARYKSNIDISKVYMTSDNNIYIVSNRTLKLLQYIK